ncbi:deoxycytidylate deaminase isoform X2 [Pipistrellus kuhlii]|nr:deoxycytidylate deaminase isoform X2 [Pipistrellus kuhlii]XP_045444938.1 deoxycytidylate deaminase isoform X2 [Pipistrellus kuhlii]
MSDVPCKKREDYLEWPEYFMAVAFLSAQRSKDPNSQVGACIVNAENKIVGIGYNGMPNGCSDDLLPWRRTAERKLDTKYPYVCHAELNAIMNKNSADVKGCTIYVALFPCNECAKLIIQVSEKSSSCRTSTTTARRPLPPGSCSTWPGSPSGNSHPSAARSSLTLIPSTAGPARSSRESHPTEPPGDGDPLGDPERPHLALPAVSGPGPGSRTSGAHRASSPDSPRRNLRLVKPLV